MHPNDRIISDGTKEREVSRNSRLLIGQSAAVKNLMLRVCFFAPFRFDKHYWLDEDNLNAYLVHMKSRTCHE